MERLIQRKVQSAKWQGGHAVGDDCALSSTMSIKQRALIPLFIASFVNKGAQQERQIGATKGALSECIRLQHIDDYLFEV